MGGWGVSLNPESIEASRGFLESGALFVHIKLNK